MIGEWKAVPPAALWRSCSRPRCHKRAVAMLNRGQRRVDGTVDAWWRYCDVHLAEYDRAVEDGQVVMIK